MSDTFNMQSVSSSMISQIGYNQKLQILRVQFKNQSVYEYSDVSHETYQALMSAESVGKYFTENIKFNYEYYRVR
jgi:hypothetical protein